MGDEYVSIEEATRLLNRHRVTVWRLIKEHGIKTFRRPMDRKAYVRKADLDLLSSTFQLRGNQAA